MSQHRATFTWPRPAPETAPPYRGSLAERLAAPAEDRVAHAGALALETARLAWAWVFERPATWGYEEAAAELEEGFAAWSAAQGWRGAAALLLDTLRRTFHQARASELEGPREALLEELAWWIGDDAEDGGAAGVADREDEGEEPWDGEPLAPGRRLPAAGQVARAAASGLGSGELVLVHGASESVIATLALARRLGLGPEVLMGPGGPAEGGLVAARRLAAEGVRVRLAPDLALPARLEAVDRVWVGTDAIGAGAFVAPIGARLLLEEARRCEVPVEGFATRADLVPGGKAEPPRRHEEDDWLLWSDAPFGVELESAPWELAGLDLPLAWWTELGRESARGLVLRSLRSEPLPPLTAAGGRP